MSELIPCPFCGGSNTTFDYYEISGPEELGTIVVCNDCGASAKSIVDWNTRPIEDALRARIAELESAQRWRVVADGELPEECTPVHTLSKDNDKPVTAFLDAGFWWSNVDWALNVTHWMPLPQPPEERER